MSRDAKDADPLGCLCAASERGNQNGDSLSSPCWLFSWRRAGRRSWLMVSFRAGFSRQRRSAARLCAFLAASGALEGPVSAGSNPSLRGGDPRPAAAHSPDRSPRFTLWSVAAADEIKQPKIARRR